MKFSEIQLRNAHLRALADLFGGFKNEDINLDTVWTSWRRWECKIHRLAEWYCDNEYLYKRAERELDKIERELPSKLSKLFNNPQLFEEHFYINLDPRGYALKLKNIESSADTRDLHRDWGSYVILAPDTFDIW